MMCTSGVRKYELHHTTAHDYICSLLFERASVSQRRAKLKTLCECIYFMTPDYFVRNSRTTLRLIADRTANRSPVFGFGGA